MDFIAHFLENFHISHLKLGDKPADMSHKKRFFHCFTPSVLSFINMIFGVMMMSFRSSNME